MPEQEGHRVVIDEPLSKSEAVELRDHLREQTREIGLKPEVIDVE